MAEVLLTLCGFLAVLALCASPVGQWVSTVILTWLDRDESIREGHSPSEEGLWQ